MNLTNAIRKKLSGVRTENEIRPSPSVAVTTLVDNPRFKKASIDTSTTVPIITGVFSIDVTNSGILPTRSTRITNAEIELIKGDSSLVVGEINEPVQVGSISGGTTETINIEFEREAGVLRSFTEEICNKGEVETHVLITISEVLLAATYEDTKTLSVKESNCKTITIDISGQADINVGQEYSWNITSEGGDNIGDVTWDMGDGTRYNTRSVNHSYSETGSYTIEVNTEQGFSASLDVAASIIPFGIAGPTDLTVGEEYTWNATGDELSQINEITWNMGDGETETRQDNEKSHAYTEPRNYTISAISDSGFEDSLDVTASYPNITIDRISAPDSVSNQQDFDLTVNGNNLSEANHIRWDMGDGTTLNGRSVTHRYATSGVYTVVVDAIIDDESVASAETEIEAQQFVL